MSALLAERPLTGLRSSNAWKPSLMTAAPRASTTPRRTRARAYPRSPRGPRPGTGDAGLAQRGSDSSRPSASRPGWAHRSGHRGWSNVSTRLPRAARANGAQDVQYQLPRSQPRQMNSGRRQRAQLKTRQSCRVTCKRPGRGFTVLMWSGQDWALTFYVSAAVYLLGTISWVFIDT